MKITIELNDAQEALSMLNALNETISIPTYVAVDSARDRAAPEPMTPAKTSGGAVPPVPQANDPVAVEEPAGAEVDSRGYVWDERIHSSNRKTVKDGSWQKRRGVSADYIREVETELNGSNYPSESATPPVAPAPPPGVDAAPVVATPVPPLTGVTPGVTYQEIVAKVQTILAADPALGETLVEIVERHTGNADLGSLEKATDTIRTAVATELDGLIA